LKRSNVRLTWIHLLFLFAVTLLPISTKFLAEFLNYRTALLAYCSTFSSSAPCSISVGATPRAMP
jgi:uncharacterized membrane protein